MSFTALLAAVYPALTALDAPAFARKKRALGTALAVGMAAGILILGYLWISAPHVTGKGARREAARPSFPRSGRMTVSFGPAGRLS